MLPRAGKAVGEQETLSSLAFRHQPPVQLKGGAALASLSQGHRGIFALFVSRHGADGREIYLNLKKHRDEQTVSALDECVLMVDSERETARLVILPSNA